MTGKCIRLTDGHYSRRTLRRSFERWIRALTLRGNWECGRTCPTSRGGGITWACSCQPPAAAAADARRVMLFTTFVVAALWPMVPDRVPTAPPVQDAQMH